MSKEWIAEIKGRVEAISPGDWRVQDQYNYWAIQASVGTLCLIPKTSDTDPLPLADSRFIANAPADVVELLEEIEVLEATIDEYSRAGGMNDAT